MCTTVTNNNWLPEICTMQDLHASYSNQHQRESGWTWTMSHYLSKTRKKVIIWFNYLSVIKLHWETDSGFHSMDERDVTSGKNQSNPRVGSYVSQWKSLHSCDPELHCNKRHFPTCLHCQAALCYWELQSLISYWCCLLLMSMYH